MKTQLTLPSFRFYTGSINLHILGISLTLMTACSVLKEKSFFQADSLHLQNSSSEIISDIQTQRKAVKITSGESASNSEYSVEIVPKGKFKFSATEGFDGEAASFTISGKVLSRQKHREFVKSSKSHAIRATSNEAKKIKAKGRVKVKELQIYNYNYPVLGVCILVFVLIYLFRRKMVHSLRFAANPFRLLT